MVKSWFFVATAVVLVTGGAASAETQSPPAFLEESLGNLGRWICDNRLIGDGGHPYQATLELTRDADGHVWVERYEEIPSKDHPIAYKQIVIYRYDRERKRMIRDVSDNSGGRVIDVMTTRAEGRVTWEREGQPLRINVVQAMPDGRPIALTVDLLKEGKSTTLIEGVCRKR